MGDHAPRGGQALTRAGQAAAGDPLDRPQPALEAGRRLFALPCRYLASADRLDQLPHTTLPEVAFLGRSNIGKSSLINALTGRKALARTSQTPGRTQLLNFFSLGDRLWLVDMPGYGYAAAPKKRQAAWQGLIRAYLRGRPGLRRLCLLIDARHGLKASDRELMALLDGAAVNYQIVLTKADKCGADELASAVRAISAELAKHPAGHPEVLATSALTGTGIAELRASVAALATSG